MLFNAFEIDQVGEFEGDEGEILCERLNADCEHEADAYDRVYWTVYGHLPTGGVEALVDRIEKEDAEAIYNFFCMLLDSFIDEGYDG